ncbi:MAG: hypothetical protein V3W41_21925 [Planctomycetota bacterium]
MTLLDTRSRPTTEAEREKAYAKPDPTEGEIFQMCTEAGECAGCGRRISALEPLWIRAMPPDSSEVQLAILDSEYDGGDVFAFHCWACAQLHFEPAVLDYANERAQCEREERLARACDAEVTGRLTPDHWVTIMEANLGYCEPSEMRATVDAMCAEYQERYGCRTEYLEEVRAQLYDVTPQTRLVIKQVAPLKIDHLPGGVARFSFDARMVAQ